MDLVERAAESDMMRRVCRVLPRQFGDCFESWTFLSSVVPSGRASSIGLFSSSARRYRTGPFEHGRRSPSGAFPAPP